MTKVKCINGHVFETNIYGNQCPLCNSIVGGETSADPNKTKVNNTTQNIQSGNLTPPQQPIGQSAGQHTRIGVAPQMDAAGATLIAGGGGQPQPQKPVTPRQQTSSTRIHRAPTEGGRPVSDGRRLVGFLVCYNRFPQGKAFNIYEGRNYIGRDASCDISIPDDNQLSGRHMSILYRAVDNKFKFRDEQSSNGTFVNKELLDDGTLENYDIIRIGSTLFIFIAIPQIF